jgi:hypothetical protein
MLTLPPGVRVFVATARVDGRKGIDGLSALVAGSQGHGATWRRFSQGHGASPFAG